MMGQASAVDQTSSQPVVVSLHKQNHQRTNFDVIWRVASMTELVVELPLHKTALTMGHLVLHPLYCVQTL